MPLETISYGDADQDFALGLAFSDQLMGQFVSTVANRLHQSVVDGPSGGGPKGPRSTQGGPKSTPEPRVAKKSPAVDVPAASDDTHFRTPRHPRGAEAMDGQALGAQGATPTYSATGVAPGDMPKRDVFYSNMSGLAMTFTDGWHIGDRISPLAPPVPNQPSQPQIRSLFICHRKICGAKEVAQRKPEGFVYAIVCGRTSGSPPVGKLVTGHTFWGIMTSESGAVKSSSGVADAGFKRYTSYHEGVLAFYQAVTGPADASYPWESRREGDTGPTYFGTGSDLPALPTSLRADPASSEPAHRFGRNLSRASGNRSEEEGLMVVSRVAHLNDFLRSSDHSRADHPGEYEAWWDSSSRDGGLPAGLSREEMLDALLLNSDRFYETQATARGEPAPGVWEEKATNQALFFSSDNPFLDEPDVWEEKTVNQARFARDSDFFLAEPIDPHDGRAGRFTYRFLRGLHPCRR